jgi:uncharacterized membrane protein
VFCSAIAVEEVKLRPGLARHRDAPWLRNQPARGRASDIFSHLRIWDTTHNSVRIYLLLADRDVEILADRGIEALVSAAEWHNIRDMMEAEFRHGNFEAGVTEGIEAV